MKMSTKLLETNTPLISLQECHRFIKDCMMAVGAPAPCAEAQAEILVEADYRGHYSHGMNRLELYTTEIQKGVCNPAAIPEILKETVATAWIDGRDGLGVVVGNFCMDLAIKKAKTAGVGVVSCKGSNHYGIAGHYAMRAADQGLIGFSATNTAPAVAPTRAKHAALGTNPLSLAAPGLSEDGFVLDMATSAVALGKIEMKRRAKAPVPPQWTNRESGALNSLGGDEVNSSYKGYGLGVMVEVLTGVLAGASYGPDMKAMDDYGRTADLGHCFVAIDPACFAPGFEHRLTDLGAKLRGLQPLEEGKAVMVAGDPERMHMAEVERAGGVRYVEDQMESCSRLAEQLGVGPLRSF